MIPEALFDSLVEPVMVFDLNGLLRYANLAALRQLPLRAGMALIDLRDTFDAPTWRWLHVVVTQSGAPGAPGAPMPPAPRNPDGRAPPVLSRVGARHWALCLPLDGQRARDPVQVLQIADGPLRHVHAMLWGSPFPAMLQDEGFRILDVNPAYLALTGLARERLIGRDPMELQPESEHAQTLSDRDRLLLDPQHPDVPALMEQRLVDSQGQLRWLRAARYVTLTQDGRRLLMTLMHETTAEHAAREQAERFSRELDQWFDLSPLGMALFDASGLVLRTNQAFERLTGAPLVDLHDANAEVKALLQWGEDGLSVALDPGGAWLTSEAAIGTPDGPSRWLRAMLRSHESRGGPRRIMCMLEDRTAEEERDLAQLQLGALVDTAGVGLSTLRGTMLAGEPRRDGASTGASGSGTLLAGVRRELVLPASLPEFERLQRALKLGERCEVRYAIDHPELGVRWLVTRVEPGRLASGRPSTSVVTLDVTDQQLAQERAEQLLVELSTILDSSPAGIASMRGYTLMHCNRRFERMLRLPPGGAVGSDIRALLATRTNGPLAPDVMNPTVASERPRHALADLPLGEPGGESGTHGAPGETLFEAEIEVPEDGGGSHWYALSIRRTGPGGEASQAIAVLSEITRLKTQQTQLESLVRERAQMAQVLGQQADRTRAVLDSVLVGIVTVNDQGLISWLNRSARRMFGGDLSDFLGQPMQTVATDDEMHPFRRTLDLFEQLRDGEAVMFECRVQGRDGRVFWVVGNTVNTLGAHGQRELTYALMDIEQRRQAEGRVAQARASLQRIIEAAPMAITLCDANSLAVLQINRAAAAQVGLSAEAAVGRSPEQLFSPEQAARTRADLRAALQAPDEVTQREYRWQRAGATQVWDARYLPLAQADGRVDQILLVSTDVSAQRAAQQAELDAAIAQREMLVQEVHHRIKNNLQGVAGLMQQIAQRRPEVQPVIAEVVGQVQAIAQVYGLQVGGIGPLKLGSVMAAIAQSVQRTFGREIALRTESMEADAAEVEWTLPESESIPIALTLNELLTNAIKHSPAGSTVHCLLASEAAGVRVEIANTGTLAADFRIGNRPSTVSGLGLVRALLPRRHATLGIAQRGEQVVATIVLATPVVTRWVPPAGSPAASIPASSAVPPPPESRATLSP